MPREPQVKDKDGNTGGSHRQEQRPAETVVD